MNCPNCLGEMQARQLERNYGQPITIDSCQHCQLFWFDDQELLQLSPAATLDVFRQIQEAAQGARQPLGTRLRCPRCRGPLRETQDMQRATRFTYFRCAEGHGRAFTFFQFLRAKNFVRTLTAAELEQLRRHVRQVNCTNCGAPVHVDRDVACGFCRTPVSILDPDQLAKTVVHLQKATEGREVDPAWPLLVAAERMRAEQTFAPSDRAAGPVFTTSRDAGPDLVAIGLRALTSLLGK